MTKSDNARIGGIDHLGIAAVNPDQLAEWYCAHFDYEVRFKAQTGEILVKLRDGTQLEIMPKDESNRPIRFVKTEGLSHLAFRVDDLSAVVARLEREGVRVEDRKINAIGGGILKNVFDPEGNMLQLVQR